MNGLGANDNDRPKAVLLPAVAVWVEVERVAPRLGIVVLVSYATFAPQDLGAEEKEEFCHLVRPVKDSSS